jgi:hypothetical protein
MNELGLSEMEDQSSQRRTLGSALQVGADVVEQWLVGAFAIAKSAQGRAVTTFVTVIDLTETVQRAGCEVARDVIARLESTSRAALDAGEAAATALARAARESGTTVSAALARGSASIAGDDAERRAA